MRKYVAYAGAWLATAGITLAVAWNGVGLVADQVTNDRPRPLTARDVRRLTDAGAGASASTTSTAAPAPTATGGTASLPPGAPTTVTTGVRPGAGGPGTVAPAPTTSTTARAASTTSTTSPPATTTTVAAAPVTRTYTVQGGSASLRFEPAGVSVVWANASPGFTVTVSPDHGNGVRVEFLSDSHRSRIEGWWDGGPQDRVREDD